MAVLAVVVGVTLSRSMPKPCTGATTLQFRPPLTGTGRYAISLGLGQARQCALELSLLPTPRLQAEQCDVRLKLNVGGTPTHPTVRGLVLNASPQRLDLTVSHETELLYQTTLTPTYAFEALRDESGDNFCGASTLISPPCVRGSSQCKPFAVLCDGPEDCPEGQACCAAPAWGDEHGADRSMECTGRQACLRRIESFVACHVDADCPRAMACTDRSLIPDFETPITVCAPTSAKAER